MWYSMYDWNMFIDTYVSFYSSEEVIETVEIENYQFQAGKEGPNHLLHGKIGKRSKQQQQQCMPQIDLININIERM